MRWGSRRDAAVYLTPSFLCCAMLGIAVIAARLARLDIRFLFIPYLSVGISISFIALLGFVFVDVAMMARIGAVEPMQKVKAKVGDRLPLMILPAIILPLFLIGYTAAKSAIPYLVGYSWDSYFAHLDRSIFQDDVWHLTRKILGDSPSPYLEWCYAVLWGAAFFATANAITLFGSRRLIATYFTAMFATWLVGGCLLAYCFSAAGPVFAGLYDPVMAARFAPMHRVLATSLGNGPIAFTQSYLADVAKSHIAVKGGGISAMPSMHLGAVTVFVLAAWRSRWVIPAVLLWALIFVCSGYFGYHYWVDGIAGAVVAMASWRAAEVLFGKASRVQPPSDEREFSHTAPKAA